MQITLTSLLVQDQDSALQFYTRVLGFKKKQDLPMGEFRWLTLTAPEGIAGVELLLEPLAFRPARVYQKALYEAGIAATAFITQDLDAEIKRLKKMGVKFRAKPEATETGSFVLFDDTCGNLINLVQPAP